MPIGQESQIQMLDNKALAELGTPASEHPETRFYPTGIARSRLLFWLGVVAGPAVPAVLLWSFPSAR